MMAKRTSPRKPAPPRRAPPDYRIARLEVVPRQQFANGFAKRMEDGKIATICRDGLIDLFTGGDIDADLKAAGLHYRDAYEGVHASGRSADIPSLASGASCARIDIADVTADAIQKLKLLDRIVEPQCLSIVRAVAGEGRSIRAMHSGGHARMVGMRRLRIGLGRLARYLGRQ